MKVFLSICASILVIALIGWIVTQISDANKCAREGGSYTWGAPGTCVGGTIIPAAGPVSSTGTTSAAPSGSTTTVASTSTSTSTVASTSSLSAGYWPVIGCESPSASQPARNILQYEPEGSCQTGGALGTSTGIANARWHNWGDAQATATGDLVDGLGFDYPATMVVYGLQSTDHLDGVAGRYGSWYTRLQVVSKAEQRGGVVRGPYRVTLNVMPQF